MSYDPDRKLLFVACLGENMVVAVDIFAERVVATISEGLQRPQGVLFVSRTCRLYVANAADGFVHVFDVAGPEGAGTEDGFVHISDVAGAEGAEDGFVHVAAAAAESGWKRIASINLGDEADNMRYDAAEGCVWVGYGDGGLAMIRDGDSPAEIRRQLSRDCACGVHPESFQLEQLGPRVFVNLADESLVQVIDRRSGTELARWQLPAGLGSNFPMCFDEERRRLYLGVRQPLEEASVLVLDSDSGRCLARVPCLGDMDDIFLDEKRGRLYAVSGVGRVAVIDADSNTLLTEVDTALGARTGFMVPSRNEFYVAAPATASTPARLLMLGLRD